MCSESQLGQKLYQFFSRTAYSQKIIPSKTLDMWFINPGVRKAVNSCSLGTISKNIHF
jgi:hypothetical protein